MMDPLLTLPRTQMLGLAEQHSFTESPLSC